jgi:hypothetical protein
MISGGTTTQEYTTEVPAVPYDEAQEASAPPLTGPIEDSGDVQPQSSRSQNKARNITIEELDYGYLVKIGCQSIAIDSHKKLVQKLSEYLKDPNEVENKWFAGNFKM